MTNFYRLKFLKKSCFKKNLLIRARILNTKLHFALAGRDIALHWYNDMQHYDFFRELDKLHANVNSDDNFIFDSI
jgi:hypothetical protein